jgi:hypothetical protein
MTNRKRILIAGAIAVLAAGASALVGAHDDDRGYGKGSSRGLTGSWLVSAMPNNCAGTSMPAAAFEALFNFNEDGTLTAWLQNSTITTTRSPSFGIWKQTERGEYSLKFNHLRYSLQTGAYLGRQLGLAQLTLSRRSDSFEATGTAQLTDVDGNPAGQGCSTMSGIRVE